MTYRVSDSRADSIDDKYKRRRRVRHHKPRYTSATDSVVPALHTDSQLSMIIQS